MGARERARTSGSRDTVWCKWPMWPYGNFMAVCFAATASRAANADAVEGGFAGGPSATWVEEITVE